MRKNAFLAGLTALFVLCSIDSVRADTVVAKLVSTEPSSFIAVELGGTSIPQAIAGRYNWERTDGGGGLPATHFSTFCIELTQVAEVDAIYTFHVGGLAGAPIGSSGGTEMGPAKAELIQKLWAGFHSQTAKGDTEKMAFQVGIWEIVYNDGSPLSVTSGNFQVADTGAGYAGLANTWLGGLDDVTGPLPSLAALTSPDHQDQVFVVPLPAPLMGGLALMGIVAVHRARTALCV